MEHGGGMNGMMGGGDNMTMAPAGGGDMHMQHHKMMMHMTFFWGKDALILFDGWPGGSLGKYLASLVIVFLVALLIEWLCFCGLARPRKPSPVTGLLQTAIYTLRVGLSYLVMLALMSFNVGVLLVAVAGHAVGFLIFGSRVCKRTRDDDGQPPDVLPHGKC
ncbi:copper transporter 6-like [Nymphaea colorata]|nr:copper transporter 6-like [Nymphaea colorata]